MGPVLSVPLPIRAEACEKGILLFAAMLYLHCVVLKGCWECNKIIHQLLKQLLYWLSSELTRHAILLAAVRTESQRVWFSKAKWAKHWPALVWRYSSTLLLESWALAFEKLAEFFFLPVPNPQNLCRELPWFQRLGIYWDIMFLRCFCPTASPVVPMGFPKGLLLKMASS